MQSILLKGVHHIDLNPKTSAPRLLEPSRSVFPSTKPVGPRSNRERLNAQHAARMQNTGPCLVVRTRFVFSGDIVMVMEIFLDDSVWCISEFRNYRIPALDRVCRMRNDSI